MSGDMPDYFRGWVLINGEMIPAQNSGRVLAAIRQHWKAPNKEIYSRLSKLFFWCFEVGLDGTSIAHAYIAEMLTYAEVSWQKADCRLCLGQLKEREGAFEEALRVYRSAFDLRLERNDVAVWYLLNNNLGFCLNLFAQHTEAERYCRAAIEINPRKYNAYKNLGIALQGQGRYREAAEAFIRATQIYPRDRRALNLLEKLLSQQNGDLPNISDLMINLKRCRELAERTAVH